LQRERERRSGRTPGVEEAGRSSPNAVSPGRLARSGNSSGVRLEPREVDLERNAGAGFRDVGLRGVVAALVPNSTYASMSTSDSTLSVIDDRQAARTTVSSEAASP